MTDAVCHSLMHCCHVACSQTGTALTTGTWLRRVQLCWRCGASCSHSQWLGLVRFGQCLCCRVVQSCRGQVGMIGAGACAAGSGAGADAGAGASDTYSQGTGLSSCQNFAVWNAVQSVASRWTAMYCLQWAPVAWLQHLHALVWGARDTVSAIAAGQPCLLAANGMAFSLLL